MTAPSGVVAPLVFVDVETTGLGTEDQPWEIAMFRRDPVSGATSALWLFVAHDRSRADNLPLRFWVDYKRRFGAAVSDGGVVSRLEAALAVVDFVQGSDAFGVPHLVGMNPRFDEAHLARLLGDVGLAVPWHFHLIDVEALALGALAALGKPLGIPFKSDEVAAALGANCPEGRHTAVGDALFAMEVFDAVEWLGLSGGAS